MPVEKESQSETREKEPIDFARIFREKLASIKPSESGKLENIRVQSWPNEVKIKKEAVALVFALELGGQFGKYELWLDDWQDIRNKISPHTEAASNLKKFCIQKGEESKNSIVAYDAFLIENQEGVWLLASGNEADSLKKNIDSDYGEYFDRFLDVCSRYNIKKVIGIGDFFTKKEAYSGKITEIFNQDIVGQIREARHLLDFVEKHRDFFESGTVEENAIRRSRFNILAKTAREAAKEQKKPYSLEGLLEDMKKENGRIIN